MRKLDNIFVVLEAHREDQPAFERASFLARASGARLHLFLSAYDSAIGLAAMLTRGESTNLVRTVLDGNEVLVERLAAPLREEGIEITTEVIWDRYPAEAIINACQPGQYDLLVKTAQPHRSNVMFNHIDWNLMRYAPCPVMLVKDGQWDDVGQVLAALDPAPESENHERLNESILDKARHLADRLSFDLHIVSAYPPPPVYVPVSMVSEHLDNYRSRMSALVQGYLNEVGREYGVREEHQHAVEGPVDWVIPRVSEQLVAEFVVRGNVSRHGLTGISLGSAAESTLGALNTSVLMVRVSDAPA